MVVVFGSIISDVLVMAGFACDHSFSTAAIVTLHWAAVIRILR